MPSKADLENALKDAMRSGDDVRKRTLRMVLSSLKLAEVEKRGPLDDTGIAGILRKEIKMRQEAIDEAGHAASARTSPSPRRPSSRYWRLTSPRPSSPPSSRRWSARPSPNRAPPGRRTWGR